MSDAENPVTAEDLHAYADGQSSAGDRRRVEAWLKQSPDDAARVDEWQAQNREIRAMFAPYQRHLPNDDAFLQPARPARLPRSRAGWAALAAAGACLFFAGAVSGHYLPFGGEAGRSDASLHEEASSAFLIYASEVRHPVEVGAGDKDHLVAWLGKRLGHKLSAPDLSGLGFGLVGGRLVPVNGQAGALLMYEDTAGKRLTILVGRSGAAVTSFRFASNGPVETFYWIDDTLSYAVTGEMPRSMLRRVADICYQQFDT
jgi:anti-sigma factor RsiW